MQLSSNSSTLEALFFPNRKERLGVCVETATYLFMLLWIKVTGSSVLTECNTAFLTATSP